jgi:acyl-CoA thioesterase-1
MRQRTRILLLGDSVTAGCTFSGTCESTCYVELLRRKLESASLEVDLVASALEGIDTGYAVKRFSRMVTVHEPDLVLVMLGLNDALPPGERTATSPDAYRQNLLGLVDRILAIDARPVLLTPNPRPALAMDTSPPGAEDQPNGVMAPYVAAVREVAEYYQIPCIDIYQRFVFAGGLSQLVPDGTHPNPAGHALIAEALAEALLPMFGRSIPKEALAAESAPDRAHDSPAHVVAAASR